MTSCTPWSRDWKYFAVLSLGLLAWLLPEPALRIVWWRLAFLALVEEIIFRGVLQRELSQAACLQRRLGPLSLPNILASMAFAAAHLIFHAPAWAVAVFVPSLVFGWIWDRYRRIVPCWLAHLFYNLCFFYRL